MCCISIVTLLILSNSPKFTKMIKIINNSFFIIPLLLILLFIHDNHQVMSLSIVIPGGTGRVGRLLSSELNKNKDHTITILCRNSFLASAPNKVSGDYGWLGLNFLENNRRVKLRDWDAGDMLDIVGRIILYYDRFLHLFNSLYIIPYHSKWIHPKFVHSFFTTLIMKRYQTPLLFSFFFFVLCFPGCDFLGWQDDTLKKADVVIHLVGGFTDQRTKACERIVRESARVNPTVKIVMMTPLEKDLPMKLKSERAKTCEKILNDNCKDAVCLRSEMNDVAGACEKILAVIEAI